MHHVCTNSTVTSAAIIDVKVQNGTSTKLTIAI